MTVISNPLLLKKKAAAGGGSGYQIEKSVRLNSGDSAYLSRLSNPGNRRIWTWSGWVKRSKEATQERFFLATTANTHPSTQLMFDTTGELWAYNFDGSNYNFQIVTTAKFRDLSAWYHIVVAVDTTQAVASERIKLYVNGEQITSLSTASYPTQNYETYINDAGKLLQLSDVAAFPNPFHGYLADVHFIDGHALSPAAFGSFNSNTNVWDPKAFTLPAPNDGTTWSNGWSGTFTANLGATKSFDGLLTTGSKPSNNNTITWTGDIPVKQGVRIYFECDDHSSAKYADIFVNGIPITPTAYNAHWDSADVVDWGSNNLTEIKTTQANNKATTIEAIEVDGVILVDSKTDLTARNNVNDGTKWTDHLAASSGGAWSGHPFSQGFNGLTGNDTLTDVSGATLTLTFPTAITASKLEIQVFHDTRTNAESTTISGTGITSTTFSGNDNLTNFKEIPLSGSTISTITVAVANQRAGIAGIKIDGQFLLDSAFDNSFHLKFNDVTTSDALGIDSLSQEKNFNDPNKAGPILTTTANSSGKTLSSGTNTDSSASSLVVAIPANSATDVHHTVKGSGSAKTVTYTGTCSASTTKSRYYGTSTYVKDDGYIKISQTNDCLFSGQLTIEGWFYPDVGTHNKVLVWSDGTGTGRYLVWLDSSKLTLVVYDGNTPTTRIQGSTVIKTGQWYHMAVCRDSNDLVTLYLNGASQGTWDSSSMSESLGGQSNDTAPEIGSQDGGNSLNGYLQDWRFYTTCKYTANFSPQAPNNFGTHNLTTSDGVVKVADATGGLPIYNTTGDQGETKGSGYREDNKPGGSGGNAAGDTDGEGLVFAVPGDTLNDVHASINTGSSNVTLSAEDGAAAGNTTQSHFYGSSMYFDGSSRISCTGSSDFQFGTGDFTVEFWLYYPTTQNSSSTKRRIIQYGGHAEASSWTILDFHSGGDIRVDMSGTSNVFSGATYDIGFEKDTWQHHVFQRDSGTISYWINGVKKATASNTTSMGAPNTNSLKLGAGLTNYELTGWLQDVRIYKGVAKYSSTFTVNTPGDPPAVDSLTDTPTNYGTDTGAGGEVRGNYCTLNPLNKTGTLSQGNLRVVTTSTTAECGTFAMTTGKLYWEVTNSAMTTQNNPRFGVFDIGGGAPADLGGSALGWSLINNSSRVYNAGSVTNYGSDDLAVGTVVMLAYDADAGKLWYGTDGTWLVSGNPATGANPSQSNVTGTAIVPAVSSGTGNTYDCNFGQRAFKYTAPSGFKALCTQNLSDTFDGETAGTVNNPSKFFNVKSHAGTGTDDTDYKGWAFGPDFVWTKMYGPSGGGFKWRAWDRIRGAQKELNMNDNGSYESTQSGGIKVFNSDGFTVGTFNEVNSADKNYLFVGWDAGTAAGTVKSGATGQTITASNSWYNQTAGFEMLKYSGTGSAGKIGHNLNAPPAFIIVKQTTDHSSTGNGDGNWLVGHDGIGAGSGRLILNDDHANETSSAAAHWNSTTPTNELFGLGTSGNVNGSGSTYMAYLWTAKPGYSSFGSYEGNAADDGRFVYTGFKPKLVIMKGIDSEKDWILVDSERDSDNVTVNKLYVNTDSIESTSANGQIDILSNGFKLRKSHAMNNAAETFIYAAFAEHPFKTTRAR